MTDVPTVELVCRNGHSSRHPLARVLSHDNAWCTRCGADLKLDPLQAKEFATRDSDKPAPAKSNVATRRVGAQ